MIITGIEKDESLAIQKAQMLGSLLYFTQVMFQLKMGRPFALSHPIGRESHHIEVCRELTKVFRGETTRLMINLPPGHYKSTLLQYFVAWAWAHYPDCNFLYISYAWDEASKNTAVIRSILEMPEYYEFFGVKIHPEFSAKDDFKTIQGGTCKAYGSNGAVTGKDAGFANCDRFNGGLIIDDFHKPSEVRSDQIRQGAIDNYYATITQRVRSPNTSRIILGQCLHEQDFYSHVAEGKEGYDWHRVKLEGLDAAENALDPNVKTAPELIKMREIDPYNFWAQYQQNPQPLGGGIFKVDNFYTIDHEPEYVITFITADTAETDKTWNDATVFSFWGIYKINDHMRTPIDKFAIHWIDCMEIRVEPKDLESQFLSFYGLCCMHKSPPSFAAIEKKSTGVTLLSVLSKIRGLDVRHIDRDITSKSKIDRYFEIQPYINKKLVSLPTYGKHTNMCIEHCRKITANNTHRHDDIADTLYDAVKIGLINPAIINAHGRVKNGSISAEIANQMDKISRMRTELWQR